MRYYCNICKKDITKGEFLYSIEKFDIPLCMEHQDFLRKKQAKLVKESKEKLQKEGDEISNLSVEDSEGLIDNSAEESLKDDKDSTGKRIARKIGRGLVMGVK
ncbi:MAG: hypothetical protein GF311_10155, partial [Candidatus Lokiarchaeota archaeon]|nr:hypothetical protein [Candidatus Lokiarchaeota archaeon]